MKKTILLYISILICLLILVSALDHFVPNPLQREHPIEESYTVSSSPDGAVMVTNSFNSLLF